MPMFSISVIDEDDNEKKVGSFSVIEGLGGELSDIEYDYKIKLSKGSLNESFLNLQKVSYNDISVSIFDEFGVLITSLDGVASKICINPGKESPVVILYGLGLPCLLPETIPLLIERQKGFPAHSGRWISLNHKQREAWLEISLLDQRKPIYKAKPINVEIDGKIVGDLASFLCDLGEKVFGPGGYIGRCLGALDDYLNCNPDLNVPFTLIWKNSCDSKENFTNSGEKDIYFSLLDVFKKSGVKVILV
jgi:RNAse (barnase) inhibitor barstar